MTEILGYTFKNPELLSTALTHKSFANEQAGTPAERLPNNERLEFLGDAVLDLALSDCLMKRFATDPEGGLSKKRASLVNEEMLAKLALSLGIAESIRIGKGEAKTGGAQKPRILASTLEAVLGAVFTDGGYESAHQDVEQLFAASFEELSRSDVDYVSDYKTRLQERAQEVHKVTPTYKVESESGPDHDKQFEISVRFGDQVIALGTGRSKKAAEQDAARKALEEMNGSSN